MSEKKLFEVFVNKIQFNIEDYLVFSSEVELSNFQKKTIENATSILLGNTIGEVKSFGGNLKKNEEKFKEFEKNAEEELNNEEYTDIKKELKDYIKKLRELIDKTCGAIIPVKEMPWVDVIFRSVPRIIFDGKIQFFDNAIAYYGEIKCDISRPIIYGKMKNEKPLFAPITGTIDLGGYRLDESQKGPKSQIFPYVDAIIRSLDSSITKTQLAKYHESFQRHGDPICDFLMKDEELMNAIGKVTSGIESGRLKSDIAICAIAIPHPADKTTLMLVTDEGKEPNQFSKCFEALLRFSAESCNAPSISRGISGAQAPGQVPSQQTGAVRTPGGQELKTWTAEELAEEAQKRMTTQPDIPVWSEEEIEKFVEERQSTLPEGMEYWTEDELQELARKRQGGLDIPEWKPDEDMQECLKCGYALRPGWSKCPHCGTPVGSESPEESDSPSETEESGKEQEKSDIEENS
ncbi:MAG: zinc ribbon domain-containing protein, partial [Promethearchaeota archaeon]